MKQGNFGTIYNFKHSIKKKTQNQKTPNTKPLTKQILGSLEKHGYVGPAKLEGAEQGMCWLSWWLSKGTQGLGCPLCQGLEGVGAAGCAWAVGADVGTSLVCPNPY